MQVIVSDTSCLIDLRVGNFLAPLFGLPYRFVIPTDLFESELLSFSLDEKTLLTSSRCRSPMTTASRTPR